MLLLAHSVIAILNARDQVVGSGFVVGPRVALTCAHVVAQAGGQPNGEVAFRFHFDQRPQRAIVSAANWSPPDSLDVALLRLPAEAPSGVNPLPLGAADNTAGHPFRVFGFAPLGALEGLHATGDIQGLTTEQRPAGRRSLLQLESQNLAPGMSGAPVWDELAGGVVGMVTSGTSPQAASQRHRDLALATPTETVWQVCASLRPLDLPAENPFYFGGATPPDLFVGRAEVLQLIKDRLGGRSLQSVSIVGERRIGKSSLVRLVQEQPVRWANPSPPPVIVALDLTEGYCHTRAGWMKALRRELHRQLGREAWTPTEDGDLAALAFALEDLSRAGVRLILCLDEIEYLTERRAEFDDLLEALRAAGSKGRVGLLTASAQPLADLCHRGGLASPFYNIFLQTNLGLLAEADWRALVRDQLPSVTLAELDALGDLAGGHPGYTQIAAYRLWEAKRNHGGDWPAAALADCQPHWGHQWTRLTPPERQALKTLAANRPLPADQPRAALTQRGLLRAGQLFSTGYARWVRERAEDD